MYYGAAYPGSAEQKERVLGVLSDLNFIGTLGPDGTFSRQPKQEKAGMEWSVCRKEKKVFCYISNKKKTVQHSFFIYG